MPEMYNVSPEDYTGQLAQAQSKDLNLWENHGWGIRSTGESDGDSLVWVAAYQLRSRPDGPFIRESFSALQSMFAHVEYTRAQKREMRDNDFIAIGWNGMSDLRDPSDLHIDVGESAATWSLDRMRFTARPPEWLVQGRQRDLAYDLRLKAESPAFWLSPREKSALEHGDRWFLVNARAEGSIKHGSSNIPISGMGWHERHVHLNDYYDPAHLLRGTGIIFHNAYSPHLDLHLMCRPDRDLFKAKILHEGNEHNFEGSSAISTKTLKRWADPRTNILLPCEWSIDIDDGDSRLELHVQAFARTYYLWNFLTGGVNILYWWIAESNGMFTPPGKRAVALKDMKHVVHQNQLFYPYA